MNEKQEKSGSIKTKMFTEQQLCAWCFIWNYKNITLALMAGSHINLF